MEYIRCENRESYKAIERTKFANGWKFCKSIQSTNRYRYTETTLRKGNRLSDPLVTYYYPSTA